MIKYNFDPKKHVIYEPVNKKKYKGNAPIILRSSWEVAFCRWCDINDNVIEWGSECIAIPYFDVATQKNRRYYPDFILKIKDKNNNINIYIVEIKPYKETVPPRKTSRKKAKTILTEIKTYKRNISKWKSANAYCIRNGYHFKIITEKELFSLT